MPTLTVDLSCPIHDSFRVRQVTGLFDMPLAERATESFEVELPDLDRPWRIGLIVGPSASGKTSLARAWFGDLLVGRRDWPADRAVIDCFGDLPIKQITGLLTAVGFGSPPAWIRPYYALSTGEQFRCDLAAALAGENERGRESFRVDDSAAPVAVDAKRLPTPSLVAFDEFTSVVDRTVAKVGSAAVAKAVRGGLVRAQFVAVTCHYDVAEWLAPDWTVDLATRTSHWGSLQRPAIELEVVRATREAWRPFARHHYLSGTLSRPARCHLALWEGEPAAFCATLPAIGRRGHWRITRLVTLPDYQGIGLGMRLAETVGDGHREDGQRLSISASHPAVLAHCRRSPRWRLVRVMKIGRRPPWRVAGNYRSSLGRCLASFEYLGA